MTATTTTSTTATISRPLFPATAAVWRFIRRCLRCLRWLRRTWWKIGLWFITLLTLAWQYENWNGRRELAEQRRLWKSEYGDMKQSDLALPRIPDNENFFAAPVFETFVDKTPRPPRSKAKGETEEASEFIRKCHEAADQLPHGRFLRIQWPQIKSSPEIVQDLAAAAQGLQLLDVTAWAQGASHSGKTRPAGLTDCQWLYATFPADDTVKGLIAALSRRKAGLLPHVADRWSVNDKMGTPWAAPIPAISNMFGASRQIAFRARAAARAGDRLAALQLNEVHWLLAEGLGNGASLVETLVALALGDVAASATAEGLASRCWTDHDLAILAERLAALNEERCVFTGLFQEAFYLHFWPGDVPALLKNTSLANVHGSLGSGLYRFGPQGWGDANMAYHLRWWRGLLIPDSPGDDLVALKQKSDSGLEKVREETKAYSPWSLTSMRKVWALIVMPAMTNIAGHALNVQTRRRQLLLAIAIERYLLAHSTLPQKPEDLSPAFLPAIPGDPWQPGTPLRWEAGTAGIRYRIISAGKDATLAMPESLPK